MIINLRAADADEVIDRVVANYITSCPVLLDDGTLVGDAWIRLGSPMLIVLQDTVDVETLRLWDDRGRDIIFVGDAPEGLEILVVDEDDMPGADLATMIEAAL